MREGRITVTHKRVILIVMDSAGIGALPDAREFGDEGSHTLGNIYFKREKLDLPNLYRMGLSKIQGVPLPLSEEPVSGSYGRAAEVTKAKDTTSGHWEIAGYLMKEPFQTFPNGFPDEWIHLFESRIGREVLGNCVASGTQIIQELGDAHVATGKPIVYTSADSVFQIAAHEQVVPLEDLYAMCKTAREMLGSTVGRVIARPFIGSSGAYKRTENRRDYAVAPQGDTILDGLVKTGLKTIAVGKIEDIFCNRGIIESDHTRNNVTGIDATLRLIESGEGHLIFTNLVDFDMLFGHRNDIEGYAKALEYFDSRLPELMHAMHREDIMIITADHGCDPTTASTDHSREYVPILVTGDPVQKGVNLGTRTSFADIGATIYEYLTGDKWSVGTSFYSALKGEEE